MPAPFALLLGFLVGMTLAWLARLELSRSEVPLLLARPFLIAVGWAAVLFGPVVGYFAARHGDWNYLYLVRWSRVPSAVDLALVMLAVALVPIGFAVATPWAVAKQSTRYAVACAVVAAVMLVAVAVFARRLGTSGTFTQYHGGFGTLPIGRSPLGRAVLLSWAVLLAGYGWAVHVLRAKRPTRTSLERS